MAHITISMLTALRKAKDGACPLKLK